MLSNIECLKVKLEEQSKKGHLFDSPNNFKEMFGSSINNIIKQIKQSKAMNIITRIFLCVKYKSTEISLKKTELNLQLVLWTVKSFYRDKIKPTVTAIRGRLQEAFGLKISDYEWQQFLEQIELFAKAGRHIQIDKEKDYLYPQFENSTQLKSIVLLLDQKKYPQLFENEKKLTYIDDNDNWELLLQFFQKMHLKAKFQKQKFGIQGGKYGMTMFLQHCGPEQLKSLSLGKLNAMVLEAIDRCILQYDHTYLIYNAECPTVYMNLRQQITREMQEVLSINENSSLYYEIEKKKTIILELLQQNQEHEIELARISIILSQQQQNNSPKIIGLPKLTQIIKTIPQIKIINEGTSVAKARLIPIQEQVSYMIEQSTKDIDYSKIKTKLIIKNKLKQNDIIPLAQLVYFINQKMKVKQTDLENFILEKCNDILEIEKIEELIYIKNKKQDHQERI